MINLKKTPSTDDSAALGVTSSTTEANYGYGTQLSFDDEQTKALGLDRRRVGDKVRIVGWGTVSRLSQEVGTDKGAESSLQLTDLEVIASSMGPQGLYPQGETS